MNATPEQAPAPDQAILKESADDEAQALNAYLQNRAVLLNAEVRRRDLRIRELEAELATSTTPETPPEPGTDNRSLLDLQGGS